MGVCLSLNSKWSKTIMVKFEGLLQVDLFFSGYCLVKGENREQSSTPHGWHPSLLRNDGPSVDDRLTI